MKDIEVTSHRLYKSLNDVTATNNQSLRKIMMSLTSTKELTDSSVLSNLFSNIHSFYKKRTIKCWSSKNKEQALSDISKEEHQTNYRLKPLVSSLAVLDDYSQKETTHKNISDLRNACLNVSRVAKDIKTYFQKLSK